LPHPPPLLFQAVSNQLVSLASREFLNNNIRKFIWWFVSNQLVSLASREMTDLYLSEQDDTEFPIN
jgi:hypothetical protein